MTGLGEVPERRDRGSVTQPGSFHRDAKEAGPGPVASRHPRRSAAALLQRRRRQRRRHDPERRVRAVFRHHRTRSEDGRSHFPGDRHEPRRQAELGGVHHGRSRLLHQRGREQPQQALLGSPRLEPALSSARRKPRGKENRGKIRLGRFLLYETGTRTTCSPVDMQTHAVYPSLIPTITLDFDLLTSVLAINTYL